MNRNLPMISATANPIEEISAAASDAWARALLLDEEYEIWLRRFEEAPDER